MQLLGGVMESYSWADFKPILQNKERLKAWLAEKLKPEAEEEYLDPEDPIVGERATLSAEAEQQALEFLGELNPEDRTRLETAVRELWGKAGSAMMPANMRPANDPQ